MSHSVVIDVVTGNPLTTDAVPVISHGFTPPINSDHLVVLYAVAKGQTSDSVNGWIVVTHFKTSAGGVVTKPFASVRLYRQREDVLWDIETVTDATDIQVQVTGDAVEDVEWATVCWILENNP